MPTIEQRLQRLEDEAAIRDLVARFADAATRADNQAFAALWAPNATFVINNPFMPPRRARRQLSPCCESSATGAISLWSS